MTQERERHLGSGTSWKQLLLLGLKKWRKETVFLVSLRGGTREKRLPYKSYDHGGVWHLPELWGQSWGGKQGRNTVLSLSHLHFPASNAHWPNPISHQLARRTRLCSPQSSIVSGVGHGRKSGEWISESKQRKGSTLPRETYGQDYSIFLNRYPMTWSIDWSLIFRWAQSNWSHTRICFSLSHGEITFSCCDVATCWWISFQRIAIPASQCMLGRTCAVCGAIRSQHGLSMRWKFKRLAVWFVYFSGWTVEESCCLTSWRTRVSLFFRWIDVGSFYFLAKDSWLV